MPTKNTHRFKRPLFCLLLAAMALPSSGCIAAAVTAGVVGAGAAGYAYSQGALAQDYPVGMDKTWETAQLAVTDLGMPIVTATRDNDGATITSRTGDGEKVSISLEPRAARVPADGASTHVIVRVAMFGDKPVSERVLNQIQTRLGLPVTTSQQVPVVDSPPPNQTGPPPLAH